MKTFDATITTDWLEVMQGKGGVNFDVLAAEKIFVRFTDGAIPSSADEGNQILTHATDWDFSATGLPNSQMVWLKTLTGENSIRGVR